MAAWKLPLLVEFAGLPGTGKSTLARLVSEELGAVLLRIDEIESAMWRTIEPAATGVAAYWVAHDLAVSHLRRGMAVVLDAVSPVEEARTGWRVAAQETGARHLVVETVLPDEDEHRRRVETRVSDLPNFEVPSWERVQEITRAYEPRSDSRLVLDTRLPPDKAAEVVLESLDR